MTGFVPVYRALGIIMMLFSLTFIPPIVLSYVQADGAMTAFDEAMLLTLLCGAFLWYRFRRTRRELNVRDSILLIVLGLLATGLIATLRRRSIGGTGPAATTNAPG